MFARLAAFVTRHWILVLVIWVVVPVAVTLVAPHWDDVARDGDFAYVPERMTSCRGEKLLEFGFPNLASKSQVALVLARRDGKLQEADFEVADHLVELYSPKEGQKSPVASVWSYQEPVVGRKLLSPPGPNGQAVLVMLQLNCEFMAVENMEFIKGLYRQANELRKTEDFPGGLELAVTGSAPIGADMMFAAEESVRNTEIATVALVIIILLLVYRSPGLVIVPLATIGIALWLSTDLLAILAGWANQAQFDFHIFRTTKIFIVVILFGAATDYCLFLISRYREELDRGLAPAAAIQEALAQTGHALTASAMTVILGLGTMVFADFGKFRYGGPTQALALLVALLACLTLTPALLRLGGWVVFWPFCSARFSGSRGANAVQPAKAGTTKSTAVARDGIITRVWQLIARGIIARPGLILVGCFLLLAWPAYQGVSVPITYDLLGELNPDRASVQGIRLLSQYFPIGETGPVTVLAYDQGGNFDSPEGRRKISLLTREFCDLTYADAQGRTTRPILSVRSLTNPLGEAPGSFSPFTPAGRRKMAAINNPRAKATYLSAATGYAGDVTRFDLVCPYDPFCRESIDLLNHIEQRLLALSADPASPWHGTSFDFIGITAGIRDLEAVNMSDYFRVGVFVSIAVLAVLVFLLRSPLVSLYLVATVLFGYSVSMGVTKLLFAWLYGPTFHGLDWKLPIFLFVILVAVGEDYNIYLATRVFEEQRRRGLLEGLRVAVVRTGGIITSCGVIMAGTFASMLAGTLRGMHQLGFALALGVLLDTFVIRTIVVPAALALYARWFPGAAGAAVARTEPEQAQPVVGAIPAGGARSVRPREDSGQRRRGGREAA